MHRSHSCVIVVSVLVACTTAVRAVSPVVEDINGALTPGFFVFDGSIANIGWTYETQSEFNLDGIFSTFRAIPSPPVAPRTVTLSLYDAPPADGGALLRTGTFEAGTGGGDLGIMFEPLSILAGENLFVAFEGVAGLGLNIVDFDFANGPDNMFLTPDDPADFASGWYTGADFSTFLAAADSPGFAAPILRFTGTPIPEPATIALATLALTLGVARRRVARLRALHADVFVTQ